LRGDHRTNRISNPIYKGKKSEAYLGIKEGGKGRRVVGGKGVEEGSHRSFTRKHAVKGKGNAREDARRGLGFT